MLDGLDEAASERQVCCVEAINTYRQAHGLLPIVVCYRSADYLALAVRLQLGHAVTIQPLSREQIEAYLSSIDEPLHDLRRALQHDAPLLEMATVPFMLNILALVYQEKASEILVADPLEQRRHLIFEYYVERVLQRRGSRGLYTLEQTKRWLAWLAHSMQQESQTEWYLERLQPDCLPDDKRRPYRTTVTRIVFGLAIFLNAALFACFRGDSAPHAPGLFYWLGGGLGNSILEWMAPGMGGLFKGSASLSISFALISCFLLLVIQLRRIPALSYPILLQGVGSGLRDGLLIGGFAGAVCALLYWFLGDVAHGLLYGISEGLYIGLLTGFLSGSTTVLRYEQSKQQGGGPSHTHSVVKESAPRRLKERLSQFLWLGGCGWLGFVLIFSWQSGGFTPLAVVDGIVAGTYYGLAFGVWRGTDLIPGLGTSIQPAEIAVWSGLSAHEIVDTIKQGGVLAGLTTACLMLLVTGASSLSYDLAYGLRYGLIYGMIAGLIVGTAGTLAGVLAKGWSHTLLPDERHSMPNEGIRRSARHALIAGGLFGVVGGISSGLVCSLAFGIIGHLRGWLVLATGFTLIFGVLFLLLFALCNGGIAVIEHYTLRWYLWRAGVLPWRCILFLDESAKRLLLKKVGTGYMFSHALLQDYFAHREN